MVVLLNKAGSVLWAHNSSLISAVAISDDGSKVVASGIVTKVINPSPYVANQTGIVYYFDREGDQLWNYSTALHYVFVPPKSIPPFLNVMLSKDGTRVVVDTGSGPLVLDGLGRLLWSYTPNCISTVCPYLTLASADASFIVTVDNKIHAFNGDGLSLWNSSSIPQPDLVNGVMSKDGKFTLLEWEDYWNAQSPQPTLMLLNRSGVDLWNRTLTAPTDTLAISSDDSAIITNSGGRTVALDPQNRVVWNSTQILGAFMAAASDGSFTAAILWPSLGHLVLRILDSSGKKVWGYGDFPEVDALTLSGDGSFLAVATGPHEDLTSNSATVVFLPGPKTLATERSPTYSWFTFEPNTQDSPLLFALPAVFATIPLLYLLVKKIWESRRPQTLAPSSPPV